MDFSKTSKLQEPVGPQRASERGIRGSEVRFLMKTQNLSSSHARDKRNNIFLYIFTELKPYHLFYSSSKQVKNFKRASNSLWLNVTKIYINSSMNCALEDN